MFANKEKPKIFSEIYFKIGDWLMLFGIILQMQLTGLYDSYFFLTDRIFTWEAAFLIFVLWAFSTAIYIALNYVSINNLNEFEEDNYFVEILNQNKITLKMHDDNSKTFMWLYLLWSIFFRCIPLFALMGINLYLIIIKNIFYSDGVFIPAIITIDFSISGIALIYLVIINI